MKKEQKITLDVLAGMMNRAFGALNNKVDTIGASLGLVEKKLDKVELRLEKVEIRLDHVDEKMEKVEYRLEGVEQKVSFSYDNRMTRVEEDIRIIKTKLEL